MDRKNLYLGAVFLVLLLGALLYSPFQNWKNSLGKPSNFLASIKSDEVNKIKVSYQGSETELLKQGDLWQIAGTKDFYTDTATAKNLNDRIAEISDLNLELVSENKEKKDVFKTDDNGALVEVFYGDKSTSFIVGKAGPDYSSAYISKTDDDKTYLINSNISYLFSKTEWADKTIFSSDKEQISKVRFQYPDSEFTIEKQEDGWVGTLPYEFSIDEESESLASVLDLMSNLSALSIPAQSFEGTGLEKHLTIVEASGDGFVNTIMVGESNEDNNYYIKRGDSDNIYLIGEDTRDKLDLRISDLK